MIFKLCLVLFSAILLVSSNDDLINASNDKQGKISGGLLAAPGQFPYQVLIAFVTQNSTTTYTGGTLIAYNWVLTVSNSKVFIK
jgi:secreted trypsin-like serine protease